MWLLFALLFSIANATFSSLNRVFKMNGFRLNFYRMLFASTILSPVTFLVEWPKPSLFYAAAMVHGISMVIGTATVLNMASRHNGRIATMFMPVQIFVSFMLWVAISPAMWEKYVFHPTNIIYIFFPFAVMTYALFNMRKTDASFKLFLQIAPIGVMYACADLFAKISLTETRFLQTLLYLFVVFVTGFVSAAPFMFIKRLRIHPAEPLFIPGMLKASLILSFAGLAAFICFLVALQYSPNPAYVTAFGTMAPVWIMLYHKYKNIPDEGDKYSAILMVISAIMLVVLTS